MALQCFLCKTCSDIVADPERGEIICSNCGAVLSNRNENDNINFNIDNDRQYSLFQSDENKTDFRRNRAQISTLMLARANRQISDTVMGSTYRDVGVGKLNSDRRQSIRRLKTWDYRIQPCSNKNLKVAFAELDKLRDKLGLTSAVVENTAFIYRKALEKKLIRGRSIEAILAACVCISCKELGILKSINEVAEAASIKRKVLAKSYRLLKFRLDIEIPLADPIKCIAKVANKAEVEERTKRKGIEIINYIVQRQISALKDPMGLAAAILYISSLRTGNYKTQHDIALAAGVTEVTLRNRYKEITEKLSSCMF